MMPHKTEAQWRYAVGFKRIVERELVWSLGSVITSLLTDDEFPGSIPDSTVVLFSTGKKVPRHARTGHFCASQKFLHP